MKDFETSYMIKGVEELQNSLLILKNGLIDATQNNNPDKIQDLMLRAAFLKGSAITTLDCISQNLQKFNIELQNKTNKEN